MLDEEGKGLATRANHCLATDPVATGCRGRGQVIGDLIGVGVEQYDMIRGLAQKRGDQLGKRLVTDVGGPESFAMVNGGPPPVGKNSFPSQDGKVAL